MPFMSLHEREPELERTMEWTLEMEMESVATRLTWRFAKPASRLWQAF